jgi:hypothetical protein
MSGEVTNLDSTNFEFLCDVCHHQRIRPRSFQARNRRCRKLGRDLLPRLQTWTLANPRCPHRCRPRLHLHRIPLSNSLERYLASRRVPTIPPPLGYVCAHPSAIGDCRLVGKQGSCNDPKGATQSESSNYRAAKPLSDEFNQHELRDEFISSLSKGGLRTDSTLNPEVRNHFCPWN